VFNWFISFFGLLFLFTTRMPEGSEALLCQYCVCVEVVKISAVEVQGDFYFFLFDIEHYHRNLGSY